MAVVILCAAPYILVQIPYKGLCPAAVNDPNYALSSSGAENKRKGIISLAIQPKLSSGVRSRRTLV